MAGACEMAPATGAGRAPALVGGLGQGAGGERCRAPHGCRWARRKGSRRRPPRRAAGQAGRAQARRGPCLAWREAPGRRKRQHGQEGQAARGSPTAVCSSGGSERVFPGPAVWPPPSQPRETGPDSLGQAGASTQPRPRCLLPWPLAPALSLSGFRSSTLWVSRSSSQKPPRVGCGLVPPSHSNSLSPLSYS